MPLQPQPGAVPAVDLMPTIRHGRTAAWVGLPIICAALVIASVQTIPVAGPTVRIRWDDEVEAARRTVFERRMRLVNGEADPDGYWTYLLLDTSPTNIALIVNTTVVDGTHFHRSRPTDDAKAGGRPTPCSRTPSVFLGSRTRHVDSGWICGANSASPRVLRGVRARASLGERGRRAFAGSVDG